MGACSEILPFFSRLELKGGKWVPTYWPPNWGSTRDLPPSATLHPSVVQRVHSNNRNGYNPRNKGFRDALNRQGG